LILLKCDLGCLLSSVCRPHGNKDGQDPPQTGTLKTGAASACTAKHRKDACEAAQQGGEKNPYFES